MNKESYNNAVSVYDRDDLKDHEKEMVDQYFSGKVLDLGCGVGRTTINLHKLGYDVIGIDYAQKLIDRAKEKYPKLTFHVMDAKALQYDDEEFGTVFFSYNGLDYLHPHADRMRAIREAHRVLQDDGYFVYTSHKRVHLEWPLMLRWPFLKIHYLLTLLKGVFAFDHYRVETHPFGQLKTYCKNNSSQELRDAGFVDVKRFDKGYMCYYVGRKARKVD